VLKEILSTAASSATILRVFDWSKKVVNPVFTCRTDCQRTCGFVFAST